MPKVTLGELSNDGALALGDGYRTKRSEHGIPGYRILRVADVSDGFVLPFGDDFVREEFARPIGSKLSQPGDVLLTTKGTVGRVAIFPADAEQVVYSPQLCYFRVLDEGVILPRYLAYWFKTEDFRSQASHLANNTDMAAYINLNDIRSLSMALPSVRKQQVIAEVLGALDDKIAANTRTIEVLADLARARFVQATAVGSAMPIGKLALRVTRGVAPKYVESDGMIVINQKCVRGQAVSLTPSRRMKVLTTRLDRVLHKNDVLVNSTGQGTLGRTARWMLPDHATADSHISIIRFDQNLVDPVCAGFGVLQAERDIEALAEGSTGQTELKKDLLAALSIRIPPPEQQLALGADLAALDEFAMTLREESSELARTRDTLLPLMMSGKLRVKKAEKIVEEVI